MSSFDGAPNVRVDVEHLPRRRYRLWLGESHGRIALGEVDRTRDLGPASRLLVAERLGLADGWFTVDLRMPAPEDVRPGCRVDVPTESGGRAGGVVVGWIDGGVAVDVEDPWGENHGVGIYAYEEVTFASEDGPAPC